MTSKEYTLSVGKVDEERLGVLNRLYNPYTKAFRQKYLPDLVGKKVLDIGCGTGIVSCYWAKEVGETGQVLALDISPEQIEIAKENAVKAKLNNIEFKVLDVYALDQIKETFDLIYGRFLLVHLSDPMVVLKKIRDCLRPQGFLFCEEVTSYEAMFSDPDSIAFQSWKSIILKQPEIYGTNFYLGQQLHSIFRELGLQSLQSNIVQPIVKHEEDKGFFYLGFSEEAKQKFVDKGFISMKDLNVVLENLKTEMLNKPWIAGVVQSMQILGQKV